MNIKKLLAWMTLARVPFHIAGVFPFVLGNVLSWYITGRLNWIVFVWSILAVELILLAIHYTGEYSDYEVDSISAKIGVSKFSGGSQILQMRIISKKDTLIAVLICLLMAGGVGILLQFYYKTGIFTITLGMIALFGGLFYSAKPIKWAYRGVGELWVGFCYGWLTLATSFYLQTGEIPSLIHWASLPIALSIFNVILINEFPDYIADREAGKRNLVVRFGTSNMSKLYALISFAMCISFTISIKAGIPFKALWFFSPLMILSLVTSMQVLKGKYAEKRKLESICARTLIVNIGITASLLLAVLI